MAKIRSGILSTTTGKVGGVVGATWKGINYVREHINPANPKSAAQQGQRAKMRKAVAFAKPIVGRIFNVYVDTLVRKMSGFNKFIKDNITQFPVNSGNVPITLTNGNLSNCTVTNSEPVGGGEYHVMVNTGGVGAGWVTDTVYGAIYNPSKNVWYYPTEEKPCGDGVDDVQLVFFFDDTLPTNASIFVWRVRRDGNQIIGISTSKDVVSFAA